MSRPQVSVADQPLSCRHPCPRDSGSVRSPVSLHALDVYTIHHADSLHPFPAASCKTRPAKYSHELVGLNLATLAGVFRLALPPKKKVYKLTEVEFEHACDRYGAPVGEVRDNYLSIEAGVNLCWNEDEGSATVTSKYGK